MEHLETTRMSSNGQVTIPKVTRNRLGLKTGSQFVVIDDRDVVILETIAAPAREESAKLAAKACSRAGEAGVRRSDVAKAIRRTRVTS